MPYADLHAHTLASDGVLDPERLVARAAQRGVRVLAVTDHDTTAALEAALAAAPAHGLRVVPGVEISCDLRARDVHLLGLFVDPTTPALVRLLADARAERERASGWVLRRLSDLGVPVTREEVEREAAGQTLGRPHFARALVRRGYVRSVGEAFERWLAEGRPACVYRERPSVRAAADAVHAAGGLFLLAHPGAYRAPLGRDAVSRLRLEGLDGVEVHHPAHDPDAVRRYLAVAAGLGLAVSGGSDFHGHAEGDVLGGHGLDAPAFERLLGQVERRRARGP